MAEQLKPVQTEQICTVTKPIKGILRGNTDSESITAKIVDHKTRWNGAIEIARKNHGTIVTFERLLTLLADPVFTNCIENTPTYKRQNFATIWTSTVGFHHRSGFYRMNLEGKTFHERFKFVSKEKDDSVLMIPPEERAFLWNGYGLLSVTVLRVPPVPLILDGKVVDLRHRLDVNSLGFWAKEADLVVVEPMNVSINQNRIEFLATLYGNDFLRDGSGSPLMKVKNLTQKEEATLRKDGIRRITLKESLIQYRYNANFRSRIFTSGPFRIGEAFSVQEGPQKITMFGRLKPISGKKRDNLPESKRAQVFIHHHTATLRTNPAEGTPVYTVDREYCLSSFLDFGLIITIEPKSDDVPVLLVRDKKRKLNVSGM